MMSIFSKLGLWLTLILLLSCLACRSTVVRPDDLPKPIVSGQSAAQAPDSNRPVNTKIGFRTRRKFEEHYEKHGREFGSISQEEYLRVAQALRDAPAGGNVLELKRNDGTISRFDRSSGIFIAFDQDLTLRTCFKPNDGERYFKRQVNKEH